MAEPLKRGDPYFVKPPGPTEEARVAEPNTRPWERDCTIKQTLVLAGTPELRVITFIRLPKLDS